LLLAAETSPLDLNFYAYHEVRVALELPSASLSPANTDALSRDTEVSGEVPVCVIPCQFEQKSVFSPPQLPGLGFGQLQLREPHRGCPAFGAQGYVALRRQSLMLRRMQTHERMMYVAPDGLEARRLALGLSREALGQRAGGLASTTIRRLERGQVRRPHRVTVGALARVLGCCPGDIVPREPDVAAEGLLSEVPPTGPPEDQEGENFVTNDHEAAANGPVGKVGTSDAQGTV
jgi:hypothetical protein